MENKTRNFVGLLSGTALREVHFKLPVSERRRISAELGKPEYDPAIARFLDLVEAELGSYAALEAQRKQLASHAEQRESANRLAASAEQFRKELTGLDTPAYRSLAQLFRMAKGMDNMVMTPDHTGTPRASFPNPLADFERDLEVVSRLAHSLQQALDQKGKVGAPRKTSQGQLITSLALHYRDCFGRLPASTVEGPFERALSIALPLVGVLTKDLHKIIRPALARAKGQ